MSKGLKLYVIRIMWFYSNFTSVWYKYLSNNVRIDFWQPPMVNYHIGKSIFTANLPLKFFHVTVAMLTFKIKCLYIHSLLSTCTACCWNLNKFVWSKLYEIVSLLFFWKKKIKPYLTKRWCRFGRHLWKRSICMMLNF